MLNNFKYLVILITGIILYSCSNNPVTPPAANGDLLFEKSGLVDSAVVNGCYAYLSRYFPDTLNLSSYSKVKVEFNGNANSDGTSFTVLFNTNSSSNTQVYYAHDEIGVNKDHSFEFAKPDNVTWLEIRSYINPPVCGTGEFKYIRGRDLKIYGIK